MLKNLGTVRQNLVETLKATPVLLWPLNLSVRGQVAYHAHPLVHARRLHVAFMVTQVQNECGKLDQLSVIKPRGIANRLLEKDHFVKIPTVWQHRNQFAVTAAPCFQKLDEVAGEIAREPAVLMEQRKGSCKLVFPKQRRVLSEAGACRI